MLKVIFWDLKKTLCSVDGLGLGAARTCKQHEFDELTARYDTQKISAEEYVKGAIQLWKGLTVDEVKRFVEVFTPYPGVKEFLAATKKRGVYHVLISKNCDLVVQEVGKKLGLDKIYGLPCEVKEGKLTGEIVGLAPDKGATIRAFLKEHHLKPEECAAVGDEPNDIKMFNEVGIAITYKGHPEVKAVVDYVIEDYSRLLDLLKRDKLV